MLQTPLRRIQRSQVAVGKKKKKKHKKKSEKKNKDNDSGNNAAGNGDDTRRAGADVNDQDGADKNSNDDDLNNDNSAAGDGDGGGPENTNESDDDEPDHGPDAHGSHSGVFMVTCNGQIESGLFPFHDNLYCTFGFVYGQDWQVIAGIQEGASQITRKSAVSNGRCTWNFPIEITFKSTNPFGWPQIYLQVYGLDGLGREVVRGYGARHLPISPGNHSIDVDMFVPVPSSVLKRFSGYILGTRAEFIDPKFVTSPTGRSVTRVESQGTIRLQISIVTKDVSRYGFRVESGTSADAF